MSPKARNLACPIDGAILRQEDIHDVTVDRCPRCKGLWLDADELDEINKRVKKDASGGFAVGFVAGMITG